MLAGGVLGAASSPHAPKARTAPTTTEATSGVPNRLGMNLLTTMPWPPAALSDFITEVGSSPSPDAKRRQPDYATSRPRRRKGFCRSIRRREADWSRRRLGSVAWHGGCPATLPLLSTASVAASCLLLHNSAMSPGGWDRPTPGFVRGEASVKAFMGVHSVRNAWRSVNVTKCV